MEKRRNVLYRIKCYIYSFLLIGVVMLSFGTRVKAEETLEVQGNIADYKSVLLQWESDDERDTFQIQRCVNGEGTYTVLANVSGQIGAMKCYDYNVELGSTYIYKVVQLSGEIVKRESTAISVKVTLPAPLGLKTKLVKESQIQLSWKRVQNATDYSIYRSTKKKKGFKKIAVVQKNTYTDCNVERGQVYYYKIVANHKKKKNYTSVKSEAASVYLKPDMPKVIGSYSKKKIKLTWEKVKGADVYYIYKKNKKGKYKLLGETNKLYYKDSKVKKEKTYMYKVVAVGKVSGKKVKGKASVPCTVKAVEIDPNKKMVALTFDDGPGRYTKDIVKCLKENNAKATFFVIGCNVDSYKSALKEADKIGCEIGNHSYTHPNMTRLSIEQIKSEVQRTDDKIKKVIGKTPTLIRTPGGAVNAQVQDTVEKPIIMWSIDTLDWKHRNKAKTVHAVMSEVGDGDIVLMHDIYEPTKEAACELIVTLRRQGYQLVTVSELAQYRGYKLQTGNLYRKLGRIKK